jgi:hypothetical protein
MVILLAMDAHRGMIKNTPHLSDLHKTLEDSMVFDTLLAVGCDQTLQFCPHGPVLFLLLGAFLAAKQVNTKLAFKQKLLY